MLIDEFPRYLVAVSRPRRLIASINHVGGTLRGRAETVGGMLDDVSVEFPPGAVIRSSVIELQVNNIIVTSTLCLQ